MIIGVTGTIGSGKSTVAAMFKKFGYSVVDADKVGHFVIRKGSLGYKRVVAEFGPSIVGRYGMIDRGKLGDIVFSDSRKLKKLNTIVHPLIVKEIKRRIKGKKKVVIDAALLFETKLDKLVDKVVVVKTTRANILNRNKKYSKDKVLKILRNQMSVSEMVKKADLVLENERVKVLEKKVFESLNN